MNTNDRHHYYCHTESTTAGTLWVVYLRRNQEDRSREPHRLYTLTLERNYSGRDVRLQMQEANWSLWLLGVLHLLVRWGWWWLWGGGHSSVQHPCLFLITEPGNLLWNPTELLLPLMQVCRRSSLFRQTKIIADMWFHTNRKGKVYVL